EEPRSAEALTLLAGYYERTGATDDLRDLYEQRFEAVLEAADPNDVTAAALTLGMLFEGDDPARAVAVYERALGVAKGRRQLLERLLALRGGEATPEYAARMEELLAGETGPEAAGLARAVAALWGKLGDQPAVRRVLERGHELAPADAAIATELERLYRDRQAWSLLAGLLAGRGQHESDAERAVSLLLEAATLFETELADSSGAIDLLRTARQRRPEDIAVVERLARALAAGGEIDAALAEVTSAQTAAPAAAADPARRLSLSL